jgi:hypothetical protein
MAKRRGYPDGRGMGAQSDFISERFVASELQREQQVARAQALIALGIAPEEVAAMLSISLDMLHDPKPESD